MSTVHGSMPDDATLPGSWADLAECCRHDPDLWLPTLPAGRPGPDRVEQERAVAAEALAVCATCPVCEQCAQWARADAAGRWCVAGGEVPAQRPERAA